MMLAALGLMSEYRVRKDKPAWSEMLFPCHQKKIFV
jgi:hypothetical protein